MRFIWDEAKDAENQRKHGLPLVVGARIWASGAPMMTYEDTSEAFGEMREVSTGHSDIGILIVVHTERSGDETRLISVRSAEKWEKRRYHAYCQQDPR